MLLILWRLQWEARERPPKPLDNFTNFVMFQGWASQLRALHWGGPKLLAKSLTLILNSSGNPPRPIP